MAINKKLEIIYHNGQPDGIRSIRRHLSTMTTYVIPRPLLFGNKPSFDEIMDGIANWKKISIRIYKVVE